MEEITSLKSKIHFQCLQLINTRIQQAEEEIKEIRNEAQLHAKSSAGDKFETGRAMADLEIEKYQKSLEILLQMVSVFSRIDPEIHHQEMAHGALIHTDHGYIYIAAALGKIKVGKDDIFVISHDAPLFIALKNIPVGGLGIFNGRKYKILGIR
jgi:hypothetical protein